MRSRWIIPTALALLLTLGVGFWGLTQYQDKKRLQTYLANRYQSSFYQLSDHVEKMEVLLAKGMVTSSPTQNLVIFSELWSESNAAKESLSNIPVSNRALTRTNKFLTQVGDFAYSLNKKGVKGTPPTNGDWTKLVELHRQAGTLNQELNKVETTVLDNNLVWINFRNQTDRGLEDGAQPVPVQGLIKLEQMMDEYPALVYDGPFSEHLAKRKALGLTGSDVSQDLAKAKMISFCDGTSRKNWKGKSTGVTKGLLPAYSFELTPTDGNEPRIVGEMSKKGGHPLWFLVIRDVNRSLLTREEAIRRAKAFLDSKGIKNMEHTYSIEQQNIATISFALREQGVTIYPDIINLKVAMDNGEILGWEAVNYYMSHQPRTIQNPKLSSQEAQTKLNPNLQVKSTKLAIIPDDMRSESLCWEFNTYLDRDQFLVYIDTETGEQRKVLKIVPTQNGKLAM